MMTRQHLLLYAACGLVARAFNTPANWAPPRTVSVVDAAAVKQALGYVPTNLIGIAARDPKTSAPLVLECYPLVIERAVLEPFPTMCVRIHFFGRPGPRAPAIHQS